MERILFFAEYKKYNNSHLRCLSLYIFINLPQNLKKIQGMPLSFITVNFGYTQLFFSQYCIMVYFYQMHDHKNLSEKSNSFNSQYLV